MSKNISVKINNGNETIETVKLNAANKKVIIKAQPHVNYELVDEATQYAPEMIDTKRVGNDLYIAFEGTDINKESDLVLEGYYEHDNTELVLGMAEDGQYYAYVPQSGVESDAVTLLADQVFAPQALGGNSVAAPFWAFNPNWLWVAAGVAAVGGIIAAASGSHGGGSSNNDTDKPSDNSDANNNSNTAKDTTAPAKPTVEEGSANAGNNPDTTAPSAPQVTPSTTDGSVTVKVPDDAQVGDTVEVTVISETSDTPEKVTLTKNADGSWTSDKPEILPNVDAGKDSSTIPQDKVKDTSDVTAVAKDPAGNNSALVTAQAGENVDKTAPAKPTIEAKKNGFVYITPPADEDTKSVEVHYIDEEGNPQTVTITKDADKGWVSSDPDNDIWVTPESGLMVLRADKVKDGSLVRASATDNQGNTGEAATENAVSIPDIYGPSMPEVVGLEGRSARVTMPKDADVGDFVVIKRGIYQYESIWALGALIPDDDNDEILATLTKQPDGSWISDKPENVPNIDAGNNSTIVPANKLKGFGTVYARAMDHAENFSAPGYTNLAHEIDSPTITVKTDGFVEITPPTVKNLKSIAVRYLDKSGTLKTTMLTKDEDGNWTSDNPDIIVEPATGKAIISSDKIKGGSQLAATAFDTSGIISYPALDIIGKKTDTTAPSAPEVIPSTTDGSVTVKVPDDANVDDYVSISVIPNRPGIFLNPENSNISTHITLTKKADGSWSSSYYSIVPDIEAGQNSTTIPQDQVKDGSYVRATSRDNAGNASADVRAQAGKDTGDAKNPDEAGVSSNTIDSNGMGSSANDYASFETIAGTINMGEGNDILEARSTDFPFTYSTAYGSLQARIDMGSGDDIVKTSGAIDAPYYFDKKPSIDGGDDFDTLEFVNRGGETIITKISALSNFEKIDIKGTLNNSVFIHKDDVERNHSAKPTVDDSGKSHNNVLIVDGDEGDKVDLSEISRAASSQVNYKGNTYHVYHSGSNELWIDSDIAVA